MIPASSQRSVRRLLFSSNFQEPLPSNLQAICPQSAASISESHSSFSEKPHVYRFPLTRLPGTETLDASLPSAPPNLFQYQDSQSDSTPIESRDPQHKKVIISKRKGEKRKSYTLPNDWTEEDDQMLIKLGTQYKGEWKRLARKLDHDSVTPNLLKYRFRELTSAPKQKRTKFDSNEDVMLAKYFDKYGPNWARIAAHFPNRTAIMVKNRYYSYLRNPRIFEILIEKAKQKERDEYVNQDIFDTSPQIFIEETPEDNIHCKEELNSEFEGKLECTSVLNSVTGTDNKFDETSQLLITQATPESSVYFKEELNSESQAKLECKSVSDSAAEIAKLRNQVEFYQTLYFKTKLELNSLKTQVSGHTHLTNTENLCVKLFG